MANVIEAFPNGSDGTASFPEGGTTGQVLAKHSNADNDVEWKTIDVEKDTVPTENSTNAVSSGGTYTALAGKVDAVSGKGLSTNDYTTADKDKLAGINLSNYVPTSQKGANNGVATLGSNGKIPMSQIPNGLDETIFGYRNETDGLFYEDAEFTEPINPQAGIFYYDELSTNFYRWTGTAYVSFTDGSTGLVLGEVTGTAYDGGKGKENRDAITAIKDGQSIDSFGDVETALSDKVDKVSGKGLSTNDYDNTEKTKVTNAQPKTLETAKTIEGASVTTVQGVADAVQTHTDKTVTDANGVHGFKVATSGSQDKIYYKSGNNWEEIELGSSIQVAELPTASSENENDIIQYVGTTTASYTNGYFYKCVAQGTDPETYAWEFSATGSVGHTIEDSTGTDMTARTNLQFVGATVTDDSTNDRTVVTIEGGGGGVNTRTSFPTIDELNNSNIEMFQYIGDTTETATKSVFYEPSSFIANLLNETDPIYSYTAETSSSAQSGISQTFTATEKKTVLAIVLDSGYNSTSATRGIATTGTVEKTYDKATATTTDGENSGFMAKVIELDVDDTITFTGSIPTYSKQAFLVVEGQTGSTEFENVFFEGKHDFITSAYSKTYTADEDCEILAVAMCSRIKDGTKDITLTTKINGETISSRELVKSFSGDYYNGNCIIDVTCRYVHSGDTITFSGTTGAAESYKSASLVYYVFKVGRKVVKELSPRAFSPSEMQEIKSSISTSSANVKIETMQFYSPVEHKIGYWQEYINGTLKQKPYYQVVLFGNVSSSKIDGYYRDTIDVSTNNVDYGLIVSSSLYRNESYEWFYPGADNGDTRDKKYSTVFFDHNRDDNLANKIRIDSSWDSLASGKYRIVFQYTKTTDEWEVVE